MEADNPHWLKIDSAERAEKHLEESGKKSIKASPDAEVVRTDQNFNKVRHTFLCSLVVCLYMVCRGPVGHLVGVI